MVTICHSHFAILTQDIISEIICFHNYIHGECTTTGCPTLYNSEELRQKYSESCLYFKESLPCEKCNDSKNTVAPFFKLSLDLLDNTGYTLEKVILNNASAKRLFGKSPMTWSFLSINETLFFRSETFV